MCHFCVLPWDSYTKKLLNFEIIHIEDDLSNIIFYFCLLFVFKSYSVSYQQHTLCKAIYFFTQQYEWNIFIFKHICMTLNSHVIILIVIIIIIITYSFWNGFFKSSIWFSIACFFLVFCLTRYLDKLQDQSIAAVSKLASTQYIQCSFQSFIFY